MKKILISALLCLTLALTLLILPLSGEEEIYGQVIRLHVLAASDREEDQALKLGVRDAILPVTASLLEGVTDREEALAILSARKGDIEAAARAYLTGAGSEDGVTVTLSREEYPTREYSGCRLPAGTYDSLRVSIGGGEGKNWWCVLFPSLCLSASKGETEEALLSVGLTPGQVRTLTSSAPRYRLKFRIVELWEEWFGGTQKGTGSRE